VRLIVAHPGTQHSYHAALGLKNADLLQFYFTGYSLSRPRWLGELTSILSPRAHARMAQHHAHADLARAELRVFPLYELARRANPKLGRVALRVFAQQAAALGVRRGCGVLAFNTFAAPIFRTLGRHGLPCVLDQTIAHARWAVREQLRETETFPEWGPQPLPTTAECDAADEELHRATLILCGSEFCAQTLVGEGVPGNKIAVVPYGTDTVKFAPAERPRASNGPLRALFVGGLLLRKGIHYLLAAAKRLGPSQVTVTALGTRCVSAKALARYEDVLSPRGFRLHADMPDAYREADVYVFPSLVEGSTLSVYEALASGLPVITTPNAGSIVRDGVEGIIVPPRDPDAIADALDRLRDTELRASMSRAARVRALEFGDWRQYGPRLAAAMYPITQPV
jgi:glycosyltransferase involved in cell wall biosynthesis